MDATAQVGSAQALPAALAAVRAATRLQPELALILGSGLGPLADEIDDAVRLDYADIPGMPVSGAPGHAGRLVVGTLAGRTVVAMQGRVHGYEGFSAHQIAYPVRLAHALGARSLLVSNACGGLAPDFRAGELMLQVDIINATGDNPLIGPNDDAVGPRFPIMFDCYDGAYQDAARAAARALGIVLREGVYIAMQGPSYATRAELRAWRGWGADAVGMSTIHEVIVARYLGLRVLGLSSVTDVAHPDSTDHATGEDVLRMAERGGATFRRLVRAVVPEL